MTHALIAQPLPDYLNLATSPSHFHHTLPNLVPTTLTWIWYWLTLLLEILPDH